jgi:alpha-2-macroglobulin
MRRTAAALAALTLVACGKGCAPQSRTGPIDLAPLPEPPGLKVAPEALPGAGGELAVVAARPQGPIQGDFRPTITFSKPVVAMGSVEFEKGLPTPIAIEPRLEGEWRWLGSATTEFVPKGLVPYATAFTVTVPKGLRSVDGSALADAYVFSFETPRPVVQGIEPHGGYRWLTPHHALAITFNQPVKDLAGRLHVRVKGADVPVDVKEAKLAEERRENERGRRFSRMGFEERAVPCRSTRTCRSRWRDPSRARRVRSRSSRARAGRFARTGRSASRT